MAGEFSPMLLLAILMAFSTDYLISGLAPAPPPPSVSKNLFIRHSFLWILISKKSTSEYKEIAFWKES